MPKDQAMVKVLFFKKWESMNPKLLVIRYTVMPKKIVENILDYL